MKTPKVYPSKRKGMIKQPEAIQGNLMPSEYYYNDLMDYCTKSIAKNEERKLKRSDVR